MIYEVPLFCRKLTKPANIGPQDVPSTSPSNIPRTSPKDPIWPSRGRPDLTPENVPIWCPGDVLKWRAGDVLICRSGYWTSRRLIRDIPRTFSGCPLEDFQSTQTWMSQNFFFFSFRTYSIDQIYLTPFQHSRCIENPVKRLRWSIFCKSS